MQKGEHLKQTEKSSTDKSGIILFAKQPGVTSFSSLFTIKHALNTNKVGHTGTLDSFAQGLLVVLSGKFTRLASHITAFDKEYEAVIAFGSETDTLDPTGEVIKTTSLPTYEALQSAIDKYSGLFMQRPPDYSAIHVQGNRLSDLARKGKEINVPLRSVCVYKTEIMELVCENNTKVVASQSRIRYARIKFLVSKGTYIRALARDIGETAGSCAYLLGLLRTSVGQFKLSDAVGYNFLSEFTIKNVLDSLVDVPNPEKKKEIESLMQEKVLSNLKPLTQDLAKQCGFSPITLKSDFEFDFYHGKKILPNFFINFDPQNSKYAVFTEDNLFSGVITLKKNNILYEYVVCK